MIATPIATLQENAAYCWFHRERAVTINGVTVFGSVAGATAGGARAGALRISFHDHQTGATIARRVGRFAPPDDHNAPALCYLGGDELLAMWQGHGAEPFIHHQTYKLSGAPASMEERLFVGDAATYSNVFRLPGSSAVLNFHRGLGQNPNYAVSRDNGASFNGGGRLIDWPIPDPDDPKRTGLDGGRPYVVYCQAGDRIHFAIVEDHPRAYDNSVYHGYIEGDAVFDSYGVRLGPLAAGGALPSYSFAQLTKVFDGRVDAVAWVADIVAADNGSVAIVFSVQRGGGAVRAESGVGGGDLRYHYARFDDGKWTEFEIACGGGRLYPGEDDYSGLIAVNPNNPSQVAFSTNHDPLDNLPLRSESDGKPHYEMFLGEVDAATRSVQLWALTANSTEDQIRPLFSRSLTGEPNALLWMAGTYRSYNDFTTRVVGFALTQDALAQCAATPYRPATEDVPERPFMPPAETAAWRQYLDGCEAYLEYGCGGSTMLAGELGIRTIYSVDSDPAWAAGVRKAFDRRYADRGQTLLLTHVDIGPTREWGFPTDLSHAPRWPNYAVTPWRLLSKDRPSPTVVLIDGRFRVACFLLSLIAAKPGAIILIDDYLDRPRYHVVERHCARMATHGRLAVFRVGEDRDIQRILFEMIPYLTIVE